MAEMVPANQGVVATTHTSQSAEGTPILDTSTSSDSHMGDTRQINLTQFNQLNQQHVLNLTADPMILAEAQRVVAEVQQEAIGNLETKSFQKLGFSYNHPRK